MAKRALRTFLGLSLLAQILWFMVILETLGIVIKVWQ
jgi:hypothetical protein